jgi:hypothetical protein
MTMNQGSSRELGKRWWRRGDSNPKTASAEKITRNRTGLHSDQGRRSQHLSPSRMVFCSQLCPICARRSWRPIDHRPRGALPCKDRAGCRRKSAGAADLHHRSAGVALPVPRRSLWLYRWLYNRGAESGRSAVRSHPCLPQMTRHIAWYSRAFGDHSAHLGGPSVTVTTPRLLSPIVRQSPAARHCLSVATRRCGSRCWARCTGGGSRWCGRGLGDRVR